MSTTDDDVILAAARTGDESAFTTLVERHRRELQVHCYRMLGSFDESEDLVQETFLRAWKNLGGFEGRSTLRAWLYRIATNACLDFLDGRSRRLLPYQLAGPADATDEQPPRTDVPWLQPFPDRLCEPSETEPDAVAVSRETIELAFLAAIQHLPPRQRAVLIMRDVLGWPARDTATVLDASVASTNSALQRARAAIRDRLPADRMAWAPASTPTAEELAVLHRYMDALERADLDAMADLLAEEIRSAMPPYPIWFRGREPMIRALATSWDPASPAYVGRFRVVPTMANRRPAAASYVRLDDEPGYRAFAISVLTITDGKISEITAFHSPALFRAFELPLELAPDHR